MLRTLGFNLVYLASCVFCDKAIDKRDKNILKSVGGPTLVIIFAFCALVSFIKFYVYQETFFNIVLSLSLG